ncbi:MAG: hypothetical protein K5986_11595 [Clostridium sp.]|uniref:hypothetical protein n=1 Tax=Clostridium sp. DSM 8431 TaxID=1761781 RepID=UPI0008E6E61C|nr:hypothetical protein [Clostridium sp. DSM 8431]MCR4945053.1 hypothetical protein [Clostridium sp.]SFU75453.1 ABC-2 type transport system permease protein [Clostridium sp. DSM 8431]
MSRLGIVTKFFVKNALEQGVNNSKKTSWIVRVLLTLVIMGCFSLPIVAITTTLYEPFKAIGQEGYIITLILVIGSAITSFFGIFSVLNIFYFSDDIELILPLPFKSSEVILGKFIALLIELYIYDLIIAIPLIAYGVMDKSGILFYLYAFISFMLVPILPMTICILISMIIMRVTNLSKHKDAFKTVSGIFMLVFAIAINVFSRSSSTGDSVESLQNILAQGNNSLMNAISNVFFTSTLSAKALVYSSEFKGLEYMLITIVISLCLFGLLYIIGGKIYYKSVMGLSESYSKRENVLEGKKADKSIKRSSAFIALMSRDFKVMIRTPQFFINCIAMMLYVPIIMGVGIFSGTSTLEIQETLMDASNYGYFLAAVLWFSVISVAGGGAALTAVSREGRDFMVSKYIPVPVEEQFKSKVLLAIIINGAMSLVLAILMIFLGIPIQLVLISTVISLLSTELTAIIELLWDYHSPNLNWEDAKYLYKKNYFPLFMTIIAFVLAGLFIFAYYFIKNYVIIFMVISIILAVLIVIVYEKLKKTAYEFYEKGFE